MLQRINEHDFLLNVNLNLFVVVNMKTFSRSRDMFYRSSIVYVYAFNILDPRPEYFKEFEEICRFLPLLDNNPKAANYDPKGKYLPIC